jgi:hypothetical protein
MICQCSHGRDGAHRDGCPIRTLTPATTRADGSVFFRSTVRLWQHEAEAILQLLARYERLLDGIRATHSNTEACPDSECVICAMRDCPEHEPLHYSSDGCPLCDSEDDDGA